MPTSISPKSPKLRFKSAREEATLALKKADQAFKRLDYKRTTIPEYLDPTESDSTSSFSPEILSLIFEYACAPVDDGRLFDPEPLIPLEEEEEEEDDDDYDFDNDDDDDDDTDPAFPLVLGAVSSRWRQIAWSTPRIWTSITRNVSPHTIHNTINLLHLYFQNASTQPVSLDLDFRIKQITNMIPQVTDNLNDTAALEPLQYLIFIQYPTKISQLSLNNPPIEWLHSITSNTLPTLQTLRLGWFSEFSLPNPTKGISFRIGPSLPQLRKATIYNEPLSISLDSPTITSLDIRGTDYFEGYNILTRCPNLIHLKLSKTKFSWPSSIDPSSLRYNTPLTHTNLKSLEWCFLGPTPQTILNNVQDFSSYIKLPSIQELSLESLPTASLSDPIFLKFLSLLPSSTTSLSLGLPSISNRTDTPHPIFTCLPFIPSHITQLSLKECSPIFVSSFFKYLTTTPSSTLPHTPSGSAVLPALNSIKLISHDPHIYHQCTSVCVFDPWPFIEFLDYKEAQGCVDFHAEIWCGSLTHENWNTAVQEKIKWFEDKGYDLVIYSSEWGA